MMNVSADSVHSAQPATDAEAPHAAADTARQPIDEKGANNFGAEFEEHIEIEHAGMVALIGEYEKTGKCGWSARIGEVATFSRLFRRGDPV